MQIVKKLPKYRSLIYDNTLYVINRFNLKFNIETIELPTLQSSGTIAVDSDLFLDVITDENAFYVLTPNATITAYDKFSGEKFWQTDTKSIPVGRMTQNNDSVFIVASFPVRQKQIEFSQYYVQKFDKKTGYSTKFACQKGTPTRKVILNDSCFFFSDLHNLHCSDFNGNIQWSTKLLYPMNNPIVEDGDNLLLSSMQGMLQVIKKSGQNRVALQVAKTVCLPKMKNDIIYWTHSTLDVIFLNKVERKEIPWQKTVPLKITSQPISSSIGKTVAVGSEKGELQVDKDVIKLSDTPISNICECEDILLVETQTDIYVVKV